MRIVKRIENRKNHSIRSFRRKRYNERINFYSDISREIEQIENKLARIKKMIKSYSVEGGQQYPYTIDTLAPNGKLDFNKIGEFMRYMLTQPSEEELGTKKDFYNSIKSKISGLINKISSISGKVGSFFRNLIFGKPDKKAQEIARVYNRRNRKFVYYSDESSVDDSLKKIELNPDSVDGLLRYGLEEAHANVPKVLPKTKFSKYRKSRRFYNSQEGNVNEQAEQVKQKLNEMIIKLQEVRIKAWRYAVHIPIGGAIIALGIAFGTAVYYCHLALTLKAVVTMAMASLVSNIIIISLVCAAILFFIGVKIVPWLNQKINEYRIKSSVEQVQDVIQQIDKNKDNISSKSFEKLDFIANKYAEEFKTVIIAEYEKKGGVPAAKFQGLFNDMVSDMTGVLDSN